MEETEQPEMEAPAHPLGRLIEIKEAAAVEDMHFVLQPVQLYNIWQHFVLQPVQLYNIWQIRVVFLSKC